MACIHNDRERYTHGYHCHDCDTFFHKDSPTYRSSELLSSIWMVLHNINVDLVRAGKESDTNITKMKDRIGISQDHKDYEEIIKESEILMAKYSKTSESANMVLK